MPTVGKKFWNLTPVLRSAVPNSGTSGELGKSPTVWYPESIPSAVMRTQLKPTRENNDTAAKLHV